MVELLKFTPAELDALALSVRVALCSVIFILVPGVFIAWLLAKKTFYGKTILTNLVHLPLVLPPVVPGFLLLILLGNQGLIGKYLHEQWGISVAFTWFGAAIASTLMSFPLMVSAARLAISQVDAKLETAAQSLGAHPIGVFFHITLPLALPGILTGMILAFARSLGEFGATITFVGNIEGETRTLPLYIYTYIQTPGNDIPALRLVLLSLMIAFCALLASEYLNRQLHQKLGQESN